MKAAHKAIAICLLSPISQKKKEKFYYFHIYLSFQERHETASEILCLCLSRKKTDCITSCAERVCSATHTGDSFGLTTCTSYSLQPHLAIITYFIKWVAQSISHVHCHYIYF